MGDRMRPMGVTELLHRIIGEYKVKSSIFGIPEAGFFRKFSGKTLHLFGGACATPVGPAAGPHTQLAQNIIAAYLTGGRFFELKTVQKLDELQLGKPCIDAPDEAYNTEWSTELTVDRAMKEYMNAWLILHFLDAAFGPDNACITAQTGPGALGTTAPDLEGRRPFAFNMSVGYDLEGIKTEKIDSFIRQMVDGSEGGYFPAAKEELASALERLAGEAPPLFGPSGFIRLASAVRAAPSAVCTSVTLSTLHGCPPEEIEAICSYMLQEKKLNTLVKLNPTLLGCKEVRNILDRTGFSHVTVKEETFTHDLQYPDAVEMLQRLRKKAQGAGVEFGIKLSNTLPAVNTKDVLPDEEMYMSGRPLFPVTIRVASKLAADLHGAVPISYCGGVSVFNAEEIFACGIRPVTMATELLKPGGYVRMRQAAELFETEKQDGWDAGKIDIDRLQRFAEKAAEADYVAKAWRGFDTACVKAPLPLFDCYIAPCVEACPFRQDVPEYIRLTGEGHCDQALELILEKNPLPAITGSICDHQCMYNCTRLDYEGAVEIREMKKVAALCGERPAADRRKTAGDEDPRSGAPAAAAKTAVIGAGPAGLSAAYFLARAGVKVTVFDKEPSAGGVVRHVLPRFRITEEALEQDIAYIESLGAEFRFSTPPDIGPKQLYGEGYEFICLAVGAGREKEYSLPGGNRNIIGALDMLRRYNRSPESLELGRSVVIVGGGNTAMDSARAAAAAPGVEKVTVCYRRTDEEMPADREEYENALEDGVVFEFLSQPEAYAPDGACTLRRMRLGEKDESGRRRPVPTEATCTVRADTVIAAVGEEADREVLKRFGIETDGPARVSEGRIYLIGDARTGPSTVAECIDEGRKAAEAILGQLGGHLPGTGPEAGQVREERENVKKRYIRRDMIVPGSPRNKGEMMRFAEQEARRCLECNLVCNKCVEVCPNRANIAVPVPPELGFHDRFQIIHIDGYCNECGNCATFCPYDGNPYLDKLTLFHTEEEFSVSENSGFFFQEGTCTLRTGGEVRRFRAGEGAAALGAEAVLAEHLYDVHRYLFPAPPSENTPVRKEE